MGLPYLNSNTLLVDHSCIAITWLKHIDNLTLCILSLFAKTLFSAVEKYLYFVCIYKPFLSASSILKCTCE